MRQTAIIACLGLIFWAGGQVAEGAAQQARQGPQKGQNGNRPNQVAANGNMVNPAVQQLLQQFDANRNNVLDGDELVQVAAAFQQLVMARMGQAGGMQAGGMQGGGGQGFANQAGMQGGGQGLGGGKQQRPSMGRRAVGQAEEEATAEDDTDRESGRRKSSRERREDARSFCGFTIDPANLVFSARGGHSQSCLLRDFALVS